MPTYIAKERGQIPVNDVQPVRRPEAEGRRVVFRIVEPGEKFEFNGKPGSWMEPVDKDEKGTPRPKPLAPARRIRHRTIHPAGRTIQARRNGVTCGVQT